MIGSEMSNLVRGTNGMKQVIFDNDGEIRNVIFENDEGKLIQSVAEPSHITWITNLNSKWKPYLPRGKGFVILKWIGGWWQMHHEVCQDKTEAEETCARIKKNQQYNVDPQIIEISYDMFEFH